MILCFYCVVINIFPGGGLVRFTPWALGRGGIEGRGKFERDGGGCCCMYITADLIF